MADITCDCADGLDLVPFPCKAVDYGYPKAALLMDPNGSLTVAGETPTLSEVQAGIAATGEDRLIVIEEITNGQLVEDSREEESGADTADGLTNTFGVNMALTGNIKLLDETLRSALLSLNCEQRKQMWIITSKGYILGGKYGYKTPAFIPPMTLGGYGTRAMVPISWVYQHNLNATDPAGYNAGFLTLTNPATT